MIRVFLAVELGEELRQQIAQTQQDLKQRLSRDLPKVVRLSWVQPASMHLTIKFLGDTEEPLVELLRDALEQVVKAHQPIRIPFERLGVFPHPQQPRVLWVGPSEQWEQGEEAKRLAVLHRAVEDCCQLLDLVPETRPFSPHLTLARIKAGARQFGQVLVKSGAMDRPIALGSLAVESLVLIKSELHPTGSVYTKLCEVNLKASASY